MLSDRTNMANAKLVHRLTSDFDRQSDHSTNTENIVNNKKYKQSSSSLGQDETDDMFSVLQSYESRNFSAKTTVSLWHPGNWDKETIFHLHPKMDLLLS